MSSEHSTETGPSASVVTWDLLIRIGHWLLAVAFVTAWVAGDDYQQVHVLAGYTITGILLLRFIWGLVGPRNARFSDFIHGPKAVVRYLRGLIQGRPEAHRGHNPAGGWMVLALLLALSVQVGSGMTLYALEEGKGPLAGILSAESPVAAVEGHSSRSDEEHEDEHDGHHGEENAFEEVVEEVHEFGADLLLVLVALHIIGVVVSSMLHRENFLRGMVTGRRTSQSARDRATIES